MLNWFLDQLLGRRVEQETERYLSQLVESPALVSQRNANELLQRFNAVSGPGITLGETVWGKPVAVPLDELVRAYGLVTGGTGSGKSRFALLILDALIETAPYAGTAGFGVLDAKGDLFQGAPLLLVRRLEHLARLDPPAAEELRRRIVIYDFSFRDPLISYTILARWPGAEPDFLASNRADLLLDLLEGGDGLSLGGTALLQKLLWLLSEFNLPITALDDVLNNGGMRHRLLARCRNGSVAAYFTRQFPIVPKPTLAALERRIDGLLASEGVRLTLAGNRAPDFRLFRDEGKIVLVDCFGENIARSVRRLLQGLVLSDIRQSIFARREKDRPFLWLCDEAQNFFSTAKLRDNMRDLLTMSRSFGTHFLHLTQNIAAAVQDPRMLSVLHTNTRWVLAMRGEPSDCAFMKSALPVTGRRVRPLASPFAEKRFYPVAEERALALDEVAHLPDRVGYLRFKARSAEAIKIKTQELEIPPGARPGTGDAFHKARSEYRHALLAPRIRPADLRTRPRMARAASESRGKSRAGVPTQAQGCGMNSLELVLWVLASPILFVKWLFRLRRTWKFWRIAYTPRIVCGGCRGTIWLVGLWRCGGGYTYRGHLLRECPVCGSLPRMVRCFACGVTEKLPEL